MPEELNKNDPQNEEIYGQDIFDFNDLKKCWDEFADTKKKEGKDAEYMVLNQEIRLEGTSKIIIKFTNSVKIDILDRFRSDLITHLKQKLNNSSIILETELLEEEAKKMIYTNKEKFDYLAEKKPILNELKDRLGLDPDF